MSCNLTDKEKTLEILIQLSVICLREAWIIIHAWSSTRSLLFHAPASLFPRSVRHIQVKRGGLERSAIFWQDWQMTSQTKLPRTTGNDSASQLLTKVKAGSYKHCVPLGQHQDCYKQLPWTIFFCFRKHTTYSKYQKAKNYGKLRDLLT